MFGLCDICEAPVNTAPDEDGDFLCHSCSRAKEKMVKESMCRFIGCDNPPTGTAFYEGGTEVPVCDEHADEALNDEHCTGIS